jgi:hypothetical protein
MALGQKIFVLLGLAFILIMPFYPGPFDYVIPGMHVTYYPISYDNRFTIPLSLFLFSFLYKVLSISGIRINAVFVWLHSLFVLICLAYTTFSFKVYSNYFNPFSDSKFQFFSVDEVANSSGFVWMIYEIAQIAFFLYYYISYIIRIGLKPAHDMGLA